MDIKSLSANLSMMSRNNQITRNDDSVWGRWLTIVLNKKTKNVDEILK
jgi:hypothetical protein